MHALLRLLRELKRSIAGRAGGIIIDARSPMHTLCAVAGASQRVESMKAIWNNEVIAESDDTVVVERNHYFPRSAVNDRYLEPSATTTECSWKGTANYFTLNVSGMRNPDAAWYYANPKDAAKEIK